MTITLLILYSLLELIMADVSKSIEMTSVLLDHPDTKVFVELCHNLQYGWPIEKYDRWMADVNKRKEVKPFEERRIGWITQLPNYKVMCCGQSAKDFCA